MNLKTLLLFPLFCGFLLFAACGRIGFEVVEPEDSDTDSDSAVDTKADTAGDTETDTNTTAPDSEMSTSDTGTSGADTDSPDSDTATPEENTDSPTEDTDSPTADTDTPTEDTDTPTEDTDMPTADTDTPTADTDTSTSDTDTPTADTDTPTADTDTPTADTDTPTEDTECPTDLAALEETLLETTDVSTFSINGDERAISFGTVAAAPSEISNAWRVEMGSHSDHEMLVQIWHDIPQSIAAGDHLTLGFYARCESPASCKTTAMVQGATVPWDKLLYQEVDVSAAWEYYELSFLADQNFNANSAQMDFYVGFPDQTLLISPYRLLSYGDMGGGNQVACLPGGTTVVNELSFVSTASAMAYVDAIYEYHVQLRDVPPATLDVSLVSTGTDWLSFDAATNLLSGTPTPADDSTSVDVTITADNGVEAAVQTFTVNVQTISTELQVGLLGHWPLDESAGSTASDVSGNDLHGTVTLAGAATWEDAIGQINGSLYCTNDGTGSNEGYVELPNEPGGTAAEQALYLALSDGESYTLSAWVKIHSVPPGTEESDNQYAYAIVIRQGRHTGLWYGHDQKFHATHHFRTVDSEDVRMDVTAATETPPNPAGPFHHVAVVFNTDPDELSYTLYVDGVSADVTHFSESDNPYGFPGPWRFGVAWPGNSTWAMEGDLNIDDVRIYTRALSAAEVAALASQ